MLYADILEHSVCSIFTGGVSRKNNKYEIVGIFIREKVWLENSLGQLEGGGWGQGGSEQKNKLWRARTPSGGQSKYVREKWLCVKMRKGSHGVVEIKLLCFRWLSPFFKHVQKGFPEFA